MKYKIDRNGYCYCIKSRRLFYWKWKEGDEVYINKKQAEESLKKLKNN